MKRARFYEVGLRYYGNLKETQSMLEACGFKVLMIDEVGRHE